MAAFQKCPLPLYLKLAFDEALRWKSYTPESDICLEQNVREIIDDMFQRLERRHGKILVSHALAYITASKNGVTEPELEDLLSLDDEVLNDVYQYWTPPVRRLPPLLWIRIRSDIGDYLTERGADGTQVVFWYHRQFIEAARERYLTAKQAKKIHCYMSDYFLGKWSGGVKKPFENKEGEKKSMDRLVAKQPLMFDSPEGKQIFNLRKLSELPFHLLHSENLDEMKEECLCNFEFLLAKIRGTSVPQLMSDFSSYLEVRSDDDDVQILYECLQLSAYSLSNDSRQLPTQMVGRMYNFLQRQEQYPHVYRVLKEALNASTDCFLPNGKCLTAPGGALRSVIGLTHFYVDVISMGNDNHTIAVTSQTSEGLLIKIIDYRSGRELRKFTITEPTDMCRIHFNQLSLKNTDLLILAGSSKIFLLNTLTGQIVQEFEVTDDNEFSYYPQAPVCFADDENLLVAICPDALKIWHVKSGNMLHRLPLTDVNCDDELGSLDARGNYSVYNIRGKSTVHFVNVKIGKEVDNITLKYPKTNQGEAVFIKEVKITSQDQVAVIPSSLDNLRLYDLSGILIRELPNFKMEQGLHRLQITDDGKRVVTADMYEIVTLNLETGDEERCLRSPIFRQRIYTRDGNNILAVCQDNILRVYDKSLEEDDENQKEIVINNIQGHTFADQITVISPSFDQRHVLARATVQRRNRIDVWDAVSGKRVRRLTGNLPVFHIRMFTETRGVGFIYDQNLPHYKVFNFAEGTIERNLEGKACKRMNAFGFIDNKRMMSFSRGRRYIKLWDVDNGKVIKLVKFQEKRRFEDMLISNNGEMVVCSQASQITQHTDKQLHLIAIDTTTFTHKCLSYEGEQLSLFKASISDDGKYLVNLVQYSQPLLWDLQTGKLIWKLFDEETYETASAVAVSGSSKTAVTATNSVGIKVSSVESGKVLRTITCSGVFELYFFPDGEVIISRSQGANNFDAWDTTTARKLASFTTDGFPNLVETIGDRIALVLGENPNLTVLRLHRSALNERLQEENLKSPYDGLAMEGSIADVQEKPTAEDGMDDDKDDDDGYIV